MQRYFGPSSWESGWMRHTQTVRPAYHHTYKRCPPEMTAQKDIKKIGVKTALQSEGAHPDHSTENVNERQLLGFGPVM